VIAVDTSALIAIFTNEDDAARYADVIAGAQRALIGSPTVLEFVLVCRRRFGVVAVDEASAFLARLDFEILPWTPQLLPAAIDALRRYGGAPAKLNFGDCLTYAVAKSVGLPLLYKGDDFSHTDLKSALV
jgi:ribonuclease VapC